MDDALVDGGSQSPSQDQNQAFILIASWSCKSPMTYSYHQLIAAAVKGPFEQILYGVVDRYLGTSCYKPTSVPKEELCFQCRCNIMTFSHQAKTHLHCGNNITHFTTHYQHNCQRNEWVVAPATPRVYLPLVLSWRAVCWRREGNTKRWGRMYILQIKRCPTQSQWVSFTLVHHVWYTACGCLNAPCATYKYNKIEYKTEWAVQKVLVIFLPGTTTTTLVNKRKV